MTNSKKAKCFQIWINVVLIIITLVIVLPFVLVFISSLTDENTLIRDGYSFFRKSLVFMHIPILSVRVKKSYERMELLFW